MLWIFIWQRIFPNGNILEVVTLRHAPEQKAVKPDFQFTLTPLLLKRDADFNKVGYARIIFLAATDLFFYDLIRNRTPRL